MQRVIAFHFVGLAVDQQLLAGERPRVAIAFSPLCIAGIQRLDVLLVLATGQRRGVRSTTSEQVRLAGVELGVNREPVVGDGVGHLDLATEVLVIVITGVGHRVVELGDREGCLGVVTIHIGNDGVVILDIVLNRSFLEAFLVQRVAEVVIDTYRDLAQVVEAFLIKGELSLAFVVECDIHRLALGERLALQISAVRNGQLDGFILDAGRMGFVLGGAVRGLAVGQQILDPDRERLCTCLGEDRVALALHGGIDDGLALGTGRTADLGQHWALGVQQVVGSAGALSVEQLDIVAEVLLERQLVVAVELLAGGILVGFGPLGQVCGAQRDDAVLIGGITDLEREVLRAGVAVLHRAGQQVCIGITSLDHIPAVGERGVTGDLEGDVGEVFLVGLLQVGIVELQSRLRGLLAHAQRIRQLLGRSGHGGISGLGQCGLYRGQCGFGIADIGLRGRLIGGSEGYAGQRVLAVLVAERQLDLVGVVVHTLKFGPLAGDLIAIPRGVIDLGFDLCQTRGMCIVFAGTCCRGIGQQIARVQSDGGGRTGHDTDGIVLGGGQFISACLVGGTGEARGLRIHAEGLGVIGHVTQHRQQCGVIGYRNGILAVCVLGVDQRLGNIRRNHDLVTGVVHRGVGHRERALVHGLATGGQCAGEQVQVLGAGTFLQTLQFVRQPRVALDGQCDLGSAVDVVGAAYRYRGLRLDILADTNLRVGELIAGNCVYLFSLGLRTCIVRGLDGEVRRIVGSGLGERECVDAVTVVGQRDRGLLARIRIDTACNHLAHTGTIIRNGEGQGTFFTVDCEECLSKRNINATVLGVALPRNGRSGGVDGERLRYSRRARQRGVQVYGVVTGLQDQSGIAAVHGTIRKISGIAHRDCGTGAVGSRNGQQLDTVRLEQGEFIGEVCARAAHREAADLAVIRGAVVDSTLIWGGTGQIQGQTSAGIRVNNNGLRVEQIAQRLRIGSAAEPIGDRNRGLGQVGLAVRHGPCFICLDRIGLGAVAIRIRHLIRHDIGCLSRNRSKGYGRRRGREPGTVGRVFAFQPISISNAAEHRRIHGGGLGAVIGQLRSRDGARAVVILELIQVNGGICRCRISRRGNRHIERNRITAQSERRTIIRLNGVGVAVLHIACTVEVAILDFLDAQDAHGHGKDNLVFILTYVLSVTVKLARGETIKPSNRHAQTNIRGIGAAIGQRLGIIGHLAVLIGGIPSQIHLRRSGGSRLCLDGLEGACGHHGAGGLLGLEVGSRIGAGYHGGSTHGKSRHSHGRTDQRLAPETGISHEAHYLFFPPRTRMVRDSSSSDDASFVLRNCISEVSPSSANSAAEAMDTGISTTDSSAALVPRRVLSSSSSTTAGAAEAFCLAPGTADGLSSPGRVMPPLVLAEPREPEPEPVPVTGRNSMSLVSCVPVVVSERAPFLRLRREPSPRFSALAHEPARTPRSSAISRSARLPVRASRTAGMLNLRNSTTATTARITAKARNTTARVL